MYTDYTSHYLNNGIRLILMPTDKFKTISIGLFLHQELKSGLAAKNSLLPSVLEQGCRAYPDFLSLQRKLESLYGAQLGTDIIKSGERHIMAFTLETAHDRFLGEETDLLSEGMAVLSSVVSDPLIKGDSFNEAYVRQEKKQLIKDIRSMLNDKITYALERCLALMCAEEKFGVFKLGKIEDYENIGSAELYSYYREVFSKNPLDLYVVGDLEPDRVMEIAETAFSFKRSEELKALDETDIMRPVKEVQYHEEAMTVNQSKLVFGYRTYTGFKDSLYCPLLVYSGVLGGFPHSKLFMKVREEAGLAYYIHSRLEQHKGLMVISAGINHEDKDKASEIIDRQLLDMAEGKITDIELDNTKRGLINQLRSRQDSPHQLISFHLDGEIGGRTYTMNEIAEGIEAVEREDLMKVADRIKADTVFLLRPKAGGEV